MGLLKGAPDYTVGLGITPSHAVRLEDYYFQWGVRPRPEGISYSLLCFWSLSMSLVVEMAGL